MTTRRQSVSTGSSILRAVFTLGVLVLGFVTASAFADSGAAFWQPNIDGPGSRLVSVDGAEIYRTVHPVHPLRTVEPFGTGLQIALWDEELAAGQRSAHYAFIEDGRLLGRVRSTAYTIDLEGGRFDPLTDGAPAPRAELRAGAGNRQFLVQLVATPLPALQQAIV